MEKIGILVELDGANNFKQNLNAINQSIKSLTSESKLLTSEFASFSSSSERVESAQKNLSSTVTELSRKLELQEKHYRDLEKEGKTSASTLAYWRNEMNKTKLALAQAEAALKGYDTAISTGRQAVSAYEAELERLNATYTRHDSIQKRSGQNRIALANAIVSQRNVVDALEKKYEDLSRSLGTNAEATLRVKEEMEKARVKLKQLNDEFNKNSAISMYGRKLQEVGDKWKSVGNTLSTVGRGMTMYLTTPLLAAGAYAVKTASDFESAFADVRKVLDANGTELESIKEGIKGLSTETASTKEEIAGVVATVGRLGVSLGQNGSNILNFSKVMVELGDVTDMTADEVANALGKFTAVTGMSEDKIENLGSAVVALGNHFAASESEIIPMMQKMAAAGKIAGLTEQEIAALSTALAATGVKAEAGGTAMTKTFTTLNKIVGDYANGATENLDLIAKLAGVSAQEFADAWRNEPMTALQMFFDAIGSVSDDSIQLDAVLKQLGLTNIRQTVAVKNLARANEMLDDAVAMANDEFEKNTALSTAAGKKYQTFEARLSQLKEEVKNTASEFGEALMPVLTELMGHVKSAVKWFGSLSKAEKENALKTAAFAAALGPVVTVIGKVVSGVGSFEKGLGKLYEAMGKSGKISSIPLTMGQIGLGIAAVTAALAVGKAAWDAYRDHSVGYIDKLVSDQQKTRNELDATSSTISNMLPRLDELQAKESLTTEEKSELASMTAYLNSNLEGLGAEIDDTTGKIKDYDDAIRDNITALEQQYKATKVQGEMQKIWDDTFERQKKNMDIQNQYIQIVQKVSDATGVATEEFYKYGDSAETIIENMEKVVGANTAFSNVVNQATAELQIYSNEEKSNTAIIEANGQAVQEWQNYLDDANISEEQAVETKKEFSAATEAETDAMESEEPVIDEQAQKFEELAQSIADANNKKREGFELMEYEKQSYSDMKKALESQISTYTNYNSNLQEVQSYVESLDGAEREMAERLLQYAVDMGIEGAGHMQTLAEATRDGGSAYMELAGELSEADAASQAASDGMTQVQAAAQGIPNAMEEAASATEEGMTGASETTAEATEQMASDIDSNMTKIPKSTGNAMTNMRLTISAGMATGQAVARNGANNIFNAANSKTGQFASIGVNMTQGLINGLNSRSGLLWSTAYNIVSGAVAQMQAAAQVHSPSRATYWIADMLDVGMANGLTDNAHKPINAAKRMVNGVLGVTSSLFGKNNGASTLSLTSGFNAANIYQAVKEGASAATINVYLDDREVSRSLKGLGVAFA